MGFLISTAGEKCFEALSHSLNVGIAKKVMFNYKKISTHFQWGNCLADLRGEAAKNMFMAEADSPNHLNTFPESV